MKRLLLTIWCVMIVSSSVFGDWDEGDFAKWVQLPDLNPTGVDVSAPVLADDWLCTETGRVTDIHIWGSWKDDYLPGYYDATENFIPDAGVISFKLALYSDIPASADIHSMPEQELWSMNFGPDDFVHRCYATADEDWYNPATGEYLSPNHDGVWQYNFDIDPIEAFLQEGTIDEPIVYWLAVQALPGEGTDPDILPEFGWKTSLDHWNDDAVWAEELGADWQELRYPDGHPYAGESMDLAFVITPEPGTLVLLGLGALSLVRKRKV